MSVPLNLMRSLKTRLIAKLNTVLNQSFSDKYLLYTNIALSTTLSGLGDIIEQRYEILAHDCEGWDKIRTRNMSICGLTIGIFCHHWYSFLDRRLPGYTFRTVMKKIVIDQCVASPVCISTLFVTCAVLERNSLQELVKEVKEKAWILYAAEWTIWPLAQFVNFYFLPTRFRVLYDNSVSLGYDIFTSHIKYKKPVEKDS